jgi:hypothetical protein
MRKLITVATFVSSLYGSGLAFAQADAYDHFVCQNETATTRSQCAIKESVLFENDASTKVGYESVWKVKVKAPCGTTRTGTYIFLTADSQIGGHTISLGVEEVHEVIGRGPLMLIDRKPELTRFWTFGKSCRLAFELVERKISEGQKATWNEGASNLTTELQNYMKIIQRRTTVLNYSEKRDQGDTSIAGILDGLIKFYKTRADNGDLSAEFMLQKLEDVRDGVPTNAIKADFDETAKVARVALKSAQELRDLMAEHNVEVLAELSETIAKAETFF